MNDDSIMKVESVLPEDFDGTFKFTNWTDEDFIGIWGKKEYRYPANSTSPMILPEHSPLEIQHIRKKFAKDLAEREFFKDQSYKTLSNQEGTPGNRTMNSIHQAATYSMDTLTPFIQKALKPLPISKAIVTEVEETPLEEKLSRNEDGEINTQAVDRKASLKEKALKA